MLFALTPAYALAQVANGSFEDNDGTFSFEGWRTTHPCGEEGPRAVAPYTDAAPGGGSVALQVWKRSSKGCNYSVYQLVPTVRSGEIWRMTAWARRAPEKSVIARVYWTTFTEFRNEAPWPYSTFDATVSTEWTLLSVTDTLFFAEGDSVGVVLNTGLSGGPDNENQWVLFDLVSAERLGPVDVEGGLGSEASALDSPYPNPVREQATISFRVGQVSKVRLTVYDILGREVAVLVDDLVGAGEHVAGFDASGLATGAYVMRLQTNDAMQSQYVLVVR